MIHDPITSSLDRYAGQVLERFSYNLSRANFDRAQRWAELYEALLIAAQDVVFEETDADA